MKTKNALRKKLTGLLICACALFTVVLAEPGAADDPLISKSYVETQLIPMLKQYIDGQLAVLGGGSSQGAADTSGGERVFKVVEVAKGSKVIGAAGTEMILRSGTAQIISTPKGGIADSTDGRDLPNGSVMPSNHLLIVPLGDGRGLEASTDIILMIKGGYTVK